MRLPLRAPIDLSALRTHLARRSVAGVETLEGGCYRRALRLPHGPNVIAVSLADGVAEAGALAPALRLADPRDAPAARAVCRGLFGLDGDPERASAAFGEDPLLGPAVRARPGIRVWGAAAPAEGCVRAILGQQVSLAAAAGTAARLVARCGEPLPAGLAGDGITHLFPTAAALGALDPASLPMPRAKGRALVGLCAALAGGELVLERGGDPARAREALLARPGIGPWTAGYIALRVLGDPDVFLASDLGVRRALRGAGYADDPASVAALAARWAPERSLALQYVWSALG